MLKNIGRTIKRAVFGTLINCAAIIFSEFIYEEYLRLIVIGNNSYEFLAHLWLYTYLMVIIYFLLWKKFEMAAGALFGICIAFFILFS